ncbi:hypothetical protein [Emiliania huxleyi virus 99B1]|nr:hypothetical protein [Emiliania huxleyi virus 99B1]|mmetsp:Transcript_8085/g.23971  ORF Transcript_8085/g.23971 Transcript_8085/m.23971 type:complete len:115 (+) Transcript_8085:4945-5289(+)
MWDSLFRCLHDAMNMYSMSYYHDCHKSNMELAHQIITTTRKSFHDVIKIHDINPSHLTRSATFNNMCFTVSNLKQDPTMMQCGICGDIRVVRYTSICPCRRVCTGCTGYDCIYC